MVDFNKHLKNKETGAAPAIAAPAATEEKGLTPMGQGGALEKPVDLSLDDADMLIADAGSGTEKMSKEDLAIPRLALLQALSDQLKRTNTAFIEGAKPGDWYDSIQDRIYPGDVGIDLVFVSFRPTILQWYLRNNTAGTGFIADLGADTKVLEKCTRGPKGEYIPPDNSNSELVPTKEYFAIMVDKNTGDTWPIMVSFAKSQVKHALKLNTLLTQRKIELPDRNNPGKTLKAVPPMFFHMWHCTTVPESNKNGDEWMGWDIQPGVDLMPSIGAKTTPPPFGKALYEAARSYKQKADSGKVNVAPPAGAGGETIEREVSDADEGPF